MKQVKTLKNEMMTKGSNYTYQLNGSELSSGTYILTIKQGDNFDSVFLILNK